MQYSLFEIKYFSKEMLNMKSSRRHCKNNPDNFCYICGEYIFSGNGVPISNFLKMAYFSYFKMKLGDQDKKWAPHKSCINCNKYLRLWTQGKKKSLKFGIPMVWREQTNHIDDCYFCMTNITGINRSKKKKWLYPDIDSARRPISHTAEIPVPIFIKEYEPSHSTDSSASGQSAYIFEETKKLPQLFTKAELNNLVRDLNLSKENSQLLASRLSHKNLLEKGTKIKYYSKREAKLLKFFSEEQGLIFCNDIKGLMFEMGIKNYVPLDWRLFIDSSKRSLKCVLLYNGNKHGSLPIGHSTKMREKQETIAFVLEKLSYYDHQWKICVDLKMVNLLLGQQGGYTKYPCFICLWNRRSKKDHWIEKNWPIREDMVVGKNNVTHQPLVERNRIILPPLHIKLGLMKQLVKALDRDDECYRYLGRKFPSLSTEKIKAGIFDGPQIRELMKDQQFENSMNNVERNAWSSFTCVINNFLGNHKADNYSALVEHMLDCFHKLGCNMSIKVHYLHSHLDRFPENLGDYSEEQGERFHQDLRTMEERYRGRWDRHMMADYCWSIQRDCPGVIHQRKASKRPFVDISI